jgi:hypothetical protein
MAGPEHVIRKNETVEVRAGERSRLLRAEAAIVVAGVEVVCSVLCIGEWCGRSAVVRASSGRSAMSSTLA